MNKLNDAFIDYRHITAYEALIRLVRFFGKDEVLAALQTIEDAPSVRIGDYTFPVLPKDTIPENQFALRSKKDAG